MQRLEYDLTPEAIRKKNLFAQIYTRVLKVYEITLGYKPMSELCPTLLNSKGKSMVQSHVNIPIKSRACCVHLTSQLGKKAKVG